MGANMAPILPIIETEFIIETRRLVGHCSAVKIYKTANAAAITAFASINSTSTIVELSIREVTIVASAVNASAVQTLMSFDFCDSIVATLSIEWEFQEMQL